MEMVGLNLKKKICTYDHQNPSIIFSKTPTYLGLMHLSEVIKCLYHGFPDYMLISF